MGLQGCSGKSFFSFSFSRNIPEDLIWQMEMEKTPRKAMSMCMSRGKCNVYAFLLFTRKFVAGIQGDDNG